MPPLLLLRDEVAIDGDGNSQAGMPNLILRIDRARSIAQQQAGGGMAGDK